MQIGGNGNAPSVFVTSSPDGALTMPKGALAIDTTTGVVWQNTTGSTEWDAVVIPARAGHRNAVDIVWSSSSDANQITTLGAATPTTTSEAGRPGVRSYSMSVAGADGGVIASRLDSVLFGGGQYRSRFGVKIPTLSDGTNNVIVRAGAGDVVTAADMVDGCYMEYDLAGNSSGNWFLVTSSNSTRTRANTGIAATTAATILQIDVNAAGTLVTGKVNNVASSNTISANIPTGAGRTTGPILWQAYKQLGAGALTAEIDFYEYFHVLSTPR